MTRTFANGPSLHHLISHAPIGILLRFFDETEDGAASQLVTDIAMPDSPADEPELRGRLLERFGQAAPDLATRLDHSARRIIALGERRGPEALGTVAESRLRADEQATFDAQRDALGRSLWTFLEARRVFDDAESFFYANHYRNCGKVYEAFELAADEGAPFHWDDEIRAALENRIVDALDLRGRCTVTHLAVTEEKDGGTEAVRHVLIVRHAGALSSVAEHLEDGRKGMHYYRPPNEATLIYLPDEGVIEICSESPGVRQQLARCFAETSLGHDVSSKPITLKQYNLSRLFRDLSLPLVEVDGADIDRVALVEIEVRPSNPRHKAMFRVTAEDDIEAEVRRVFGEENVFRRAAAIGRVVIAVRYIRPGQRKRRTLNITLSHPNRCNLRSNRDPFEREMGYALLEAWGILQPLEPLSAEDERALFPVLLDLYDQPADEVVAGHLRQRGIDVAALAAHGFIERRGRHELALIDEDDQGPDEVEVASLGRPGQLAFEDPVDGRSVAIGDDLFERYAIKRSWLEEVLLKQLKGLLAKPSLARIDECLVFLGEIEIGGEPVRCHLARNISDPKVLKRLDTLLRGQSGHGVGLILAAGGQPPLCLGANVVVPLGDHVSEEATGPLLDLDSLAVVFEQNRMKALGGMTAELRKSGRHTATLYVPGKRPYTLMGPNQILIFQRLVDAHRTGNPAVLTGDLLKDMSVRSPSQAFRDWKQILDVYIGQAGKRGSWQLLT